LSDELVVDLVTEVVAAGLHEHVAQPTVKALEHPGEHVAARDRVEIDHVVDDGVVDSAMDVVVMRLVVEHVEAQVLVTIAGVEHMDRDAGVEEPTLG